MILIVIATAPIIALILFFYHKDRYEKEPLSLLGKSFFLGILIVIPAVIIESFFATLFMFTPTTTSLFIVFFYAFVGVGVVEEGMKFLALFGLVYYNEEFDEPYDGIMYAVMVSMGFAFIENLMYVLKGGIQVGITRAVLAVPAHALFAVIMGYYIGCAKFHKDSGIKKKYLWLSLIVPSLMHGLYDFLLMSKIEFLAFFVLPLLYFSWRFTFKAIAIQNSRSPYLRK